MRILALSAAALLASATAAIAAPASVTVAVAPELQKTFEKTYGVREAERLTADLQSSVEKTLARSGAHDGARIELVLTDVKPNRPTFKQLSDKPGLSMQSFGIGGAAIKGKIVAADGSEKPLSYHWYESDIRQASYNWIWSDAEWTFDRFARKLARDAEIAQR
ncbi:MAG: hypothetical protein ACK56C_02700 [Alphaproteobacteria bacterium]|jgi:hypothetical protein